MKALRLEQLVARLEALPPGRVDPAMVAAVMADGVLDEAELRRFVGVHPDHYARRRVHRSARFELLVLTWAPGQGTPIHNHAGNHGWVRLCRGRIVEQLYDLAPSVDPDWAVRGDLPARGGRVELRSRSTTEIATIGAVAAVDRVRAIHRLTNPASQGGEVAVTLHAYSLPHDACLVFDAADGTCGRREFALDAMPG